jgi:regulator of RNase E activity RraA
MSMTTYHEPAELVPRPLLDRAAKLGTAQLCDGMAGLGIIREGCLDTAILPVSDTMTMAGTAYTVETEEGDNFPIHVAIYQSKPGYVLVVDGKGYTDRAYLGDLLVSAAEAVGIAGIVIDGCVRDKIGLQKLNLPVFSRGYIQRSPVKKGPGAINIPIICGGAAVKPGDLVVGDYDGVTVVPRDHIAQVLDNAEKKAAYESNRRAVIQEYRECRRTNRPLPNLAPDWVSGMLKNQHTPL